MKAIAYFLHFLWSLILFVFYGCIAAALIESCCFLLHLMGLTDGASWNDFFKEAFIVFVMLVGIGVAAVIKEMYHYWTDPESKNREWETRQLPTPNFPCAKIVYFINYTISLPQYLDHSVQRKHPLPKR